MTRAIRVLLAVIGASALVCAPIVPASARQPEAGQNAGQDAPPPKMTELTPQPIGEAEADTSLPAKDRTVALKDLREAPAAGDAPKPSPGKIALVSKNFDELSRLQGGPSRSAGDEPRPIAPGR